MLLSNEKQKKYSERILFSRLRVLDSYGFYGILLMHMKFKIADDVETACTDGEFIIFGSKFLDTLKDSELDFILMHEVMHVALKHCFRGRNYPNQELMNIACDIVVNSNLLSSFNEDLKRISVNGNVSMHLAPDLKEGRLYTCEEIYEMLVENLKGKNKKEALDLFKNMGICIANSDSKQIISVKLDQDGSTINVKSSDSHEYWIDTGDDNTLEDEWNSRLKSAMESLRVKDGSNGSGGAPLGAKREIDELTNPTVDWRTLLNDFISFEINDYSFTPPDRRHQGDFFLPDYNEPEEVMDIKVLFDVDTSGSISDLELTQAFTEIKGAIEASNNRIKGYLLFSDAKVYKPIPFESVSDILKSDIRGGGGTDFDIIFKKLDEITSLLGKEPDAIIILTDGYAKFPKESVRKNIPVLWIINNKEVTPPWGVVARMKVKT